MEIDLIFDSNEDHYFLHYNFDYNFHYQFDEDYYNYSNVADQNIDYVVDQIDDDYNVVVVNDLWNNVM
jgi:hypothetical protein